MKQGILAAALAAFAVLGAPIAHDPGPPASAAGPPQARTVYRHFTPTAEASPRMLERIQEAEQRRWGGPDTSGLLSCESTMGVHESNGAYGGVAMFGDHEWSVSWGSVVRDKARRVTLSTRRKVGGQVVKFVNTGILPLRASKYHDWAAVRALQRAKSGDGPDWSWDC